MAATPLVSEAPRPGRARLVLFYTVLFHVWWVENRQGGRGFCLGEGSTPVTQWTRGGRREEGKERGRKGGKHGEGGGVVEMTSYWHFCDWKVPTVLVI